MKSQIARAILCVLSLVYIPVYLFVLFVALATNGDELIREPWAWYAAVVPLSYVGFVGAYAFGVVKRRISRSITVALHIGVAPALLYSFLGLGLLLPVFAALFWWFMTREQVPAAVGRTKSMAEHDQNKTLPIVLSKASDVSRVLYPDVHLAGGLVALLQRWFESLDPEVRVSAVPPEVAGPAYARVEAQDRFSQVYLAAEQRLFLVDFWSRGVCLASGAFKEPEIAARAICCWTRERIVTKELASRFRELVVAPRAEVSEEGREVNERWRSYLERPPFPELGAVIRAAAALPELRMLFPFTSMNVLCFSRCTGYPYTADCPMIAPSGSGRYTVLMRNGTKSREVVAEDAVRFVVANLPQGCGPAAPGTAESFRDVETKR